MTGSMKLHWMTSSTQATGETSFNVMKSLSQSKYPSPYKTNISLVILISIFYHFILLSFLAYKQSRRRHDDIAIVNSAFNLTLDGKNNIVDFKMAFGGMAPTTKLALMTCEKMIGQKFDKVILEEVNKELLKEFALPPNVPGSMVRYRQSLVLSFFFKFFLTTMKKLSGDFDPQDTSATDEVTKESISSYQLYEKKVETTTTDIAGKPIKHKAADKQVSGTAVYVDDMPKIEGELYLGLGNYPIEKKRIGTKQFNNL